MRYMSLFLSCYCDYYQALWLCVVIPKQVIVVNVIRVVIYQKEYKIVKSHCFICE